MKNPYFVMFHKTMKKYINYSKKENENKNNTIEKNGERKGFRQCQLYNELFEIHQKETVREDGGIGEAQVSRWIGGRESIPGWILTPNFHDIKGCSCHYSGVFEKYIDEINIFGSMETERKLAEEMYRLKVGWGINLSSVTKDDNLWDILAELLATALVCDYAQNTVSLEMGLEQHLLRMVKFCKEKDVAFKTPFLLSALFRTDRSLLPFTLNRLEKGLGAKWRKQIKKYMDAEHSQTFEEINLDESELLNYAKIRSCLNNKTVMDELEFCCAIVGFPGSSNTLEQLKNMLCEYGYDDYGKWRELLRQNMKMLGGTSINYWFFH